MCYPKACRKCGKTTWGGCGQHIDAVRRQVTPARWCDGHSADPMDPNGTWLSRLLGR